MVEGGATGSGGLEGVDGGGAELSTGLAGIGYVGGGKGCGGLLGWVGEVGGDWLTAGVRGGGELAGGG